MSSVAEYKVAKAIIAGNPLDENILAEITGRSVEEVRIVLAKLFPEEFDNTPRKFATIEELVSFARPIFERSGIESILQYEHFPHACCCLGPWKDEPLCHCTMSEQLAKNKEQVAAILMKE